MSTILYTAAELANWIAAATASGATDYPRALELGAIAAHSNARAYSERYAEPLDWEAIPTRDELEKLSLEILAHPETWLQTMTRGTNLVYNCAEDTELNTPRAEFDGATLREVLDPIEDHFEKWLDDLHRTARRREEDAAAFADVEPLPKLTGAEIRAKAGDNKRVIFAEFMVNESDLMTDYHGARSARVVVIGFGKGKRENFHELRQRAAEFPPTAHLSPGCDEWSVWVNHEKQENGYTPRTKEGGTFLTEQAAKAWIESEIETFNQGGDYSQAGIRAASWGYSVSMESVEHRENYSMGGGNYLGRSRYSGWQVYSYETASGYYLGDNVSLEFFEPPRKVVDGKVIEPAKVTRPKNPDAVPFPSWSESGFLRKDSWISSSHYYRKEETAEADAAKLRKLGYVIEIVPVRSRRGSISLKAEYKIKLISAPETTPAPTEETPAETSDTTATPAPGELWTIQKRFHDKRGADFFLVVPGFNMERSDYDAALTAARNSGGWQSRAWKGAPSGFGFASQGLAESFASKMRGETATETTEDRHEPATLPQGSAAMVPEFAEFLFL